MCDRGEEGGREKRDSARENKEGARYKKAMRDLSADLPYVVIFVSSLSIV